ncbi:MAG: stage 0 sporulation family protein [Hyphomicrobiales bacterium]
MNEIHDIHPEPNGAHGETEPSASASVSTVAAPVAPPPPPATPDVVEVVFKGRRREYYTNPRELPFREGDYVIVQAERGEDLGRVHHTSEWVKAEHLTGPLRPVVRAARAEDLERLEQNRGKEERAFATCKDRIVHRDLEMKLVDCEYQLDGNRVTFFFTAEKRVDFRDLVKDLASVFRTRIELRQIGVRDEAGRIGGVGTCGRELCCATWLREFEPITLKMAKDQGLSPSPSKISGACGRLKCCLRYELDFYKESAREFPKIGSRITLGSADWEVGRVDIFHRTLLLRDELGSEQTMLLEELPPGTRIVGPSRDRRKGCDKTTCGARGARPGDGESVRRGDAGRGGGSAVRRGPGDRPRDDRGPREDRGPRDDRTARDDRGSRDDRGPRDDRGAANDRGMRETRPEAQRPEGGRPEAGRPGRRRRGGRGRHDRGGPDRGAQDRGGDRAPGGGSPGGGERGPNDRDASGPSSTEG